MLIACCSNKTLKKFGSYSLVKTLKRMIETVKKQNESKTLTLENPKNGETSRFLIFKFFNFHTYFFPFFLWLIYGRAREFVVCIYTESFLCSSSKSGFILWTLNSAVFIYCCLSNANQDGIFWSGKSVNLLNKRVEV